MRPIKTAKLCSEAANRRPQSHAALSWSLQTCPTRPGLAFHSKEKKNYNKHSRASTERELPIMKMSVVFLHNECKVTYKAEREVAVKFTQFLYNMDHAQVFTQNSQLL